MEESVKILKHMEFDMMNISLRSDGLIHIDVFRDKEIDIQHVIIIVDAVGRIGEGKRYPVLITADENTLPTHEARQYIASIESDPYSIADAFVVRSLAQKLVGKFFLSFNKPARPTQIFNDEKTAVAWLKTFL